MRLQFSMFALFLSLLCPFSISTSSAETRSHALAVQLDHLLDEGRYDEARALLRANLASAPDAGLHYGHFEGLILVHQGRIDDAIRMFRAVLTAAPNFAPSRVELAKLLYRTGQMDAASYHFEAIDLGGQDVALKRLAESYLARIKSDRPYGFSGYISLLPTTNVNRGTDATTFQNIFVINPASRRQSGVGFAAGGNAFRRFAVGQASSLMLSGAVDAKKYTQSTAYDEINVSGSALYLREIGKATVRFGPAAEYQLQGWQPYLTRYGVTGGVTVPTGSRTTLDFSISTLWQNYAFLDYRDGWLVNGAATARHMLSPSLSISTTVGLAIERTQRGHLDHNDFRVTGQINKEWSGGLLTSGFLTYERHQYLGVYPLTPAPRKDNLVSVGVRLAHRSFSLAGFAPQLKYEYTRQVSNVSFYDYSSHDLSVTVTKHF